MSQIIGKKIGFIGAGVMGKFMILNLMKKGFEVEVYARNKEKIKDISQLLNDKT